MMLTFNGETIAGFSVDLTPVDWQHSLADATAALGAPDRETIPSHHAGERDSQWWRWRVGRLAINYTIWTGLAGGSEERHSIMVTAESAAPLAGPAGPANQADRSGSRASLAEPVAAAGAWRILALHEKTCFLLTDVFGVSTPEELVAKFRRQGVTYVIHRTDEGKVELHNVSERDNILALYKDREACETIAGLNWRNE